MDRCAWLKDKMPSLQPPWAQPIISRNNSANRRTRKVPISQIPNELLEGESLLRSIPPFLRYKANLLGLEEELVSDNWRKVTLSPQTIRSYSATFSSFRKPLRKSQDE